MAIKASASDLKSIMRQFKLVDDNDRLRRIEDIKISNPLPTNTLVSFRFDKWQLAVLYDEAADDNLDYLYKQVREIAGVGEFVPNPSPEYDTYSLFHRGKTIYLFSSQVGKKRLDTILAEDHPSRSRNAWQKQIKAGRVLVNGKTVKLPRYEVSATDTVTVEIPDEPDFSKDSLPIIHLDDNVIVIDKPAGTLTHTKGSASDEFTVADFFKRYTEVGLGTNRPGVVHRLDRDTSGVMIGVLTNESNRLIARQFSDRKVKKKYLAVVTGHLKEKEAKIDLPIGRNPSSPSTFRVDPSGREAITHYKVIAENDSESLVELRPETGRTHQLRVHLSYLGTPIKGDRVYGKVADRLYLHANQLEVTIPKSDRRTFTSPVPLIFLEDFKGVQL